MGKRLSPKETVRNAKRSIGKKGYDALDNNCEHLATKCKTGKAKSKQSSDFKDKVATAGAVAVYGTIGGIFGGPPGAIAGASLVLAADAEESKSKQKSKPKSKPKQKSQ